MSKHLQYGDRAIRKADLDDERIQFVIMRQYVYMSRTSYPISVLQAYAWFEKQPDDTTFYFPGTWRSWLRSWMKTHEARQKFEGPHPGGDLEAWPPVY